MLAYKWAYQAGLDHSNIIIMRLLIWVAIAIIRTSRAALRLLDHHQHPAEPFELPTLIYLDIFSDEYDYHSPPPPPDQTTTTTHNPDHHHSPAHFPWRDPLQEPDPIQSQPSNPNNNFFQLSPYCTDHLSTHPDNLPQSSSAHAATPGKKRKTVDDDQLPGQRNSSKHFRHPESGPAEPGPSTYVPRNQKPPSSATLMIGQKRRLHDDDNRGRLRPLREQHSGRAEFLRAINGKWDARAQRMNNNNNRPDPPGPQTRRISPAISLTRKNVDGIPKPPAQSTSYYPRPWEEVQLKAHRFAGHPRFGQPFDALVRQSKSHYDLLTQVVSHRNSAGSLDHQTLPTILSGSRTPDRLQEEEEESTDRPMSVIAEAGRAPLSLAVGHEDRFTRLSFSPTMFLMNHSPVDDQDEGSREFGRVLEAVFGRPREDPVRFILIPAAHARQIRAQLRPRLKALIQSGPFNRSLTQKIRDSFLPHLGLWKAFYDRRLGVPLDRQLLQLFRTSTPSPASLRTLEDSQQLCYLFLFYVHIIVSILSPPPSSSDHSLSSPVDPSPTHHHQEEEALHRAADSLQRQFVHRLSLVAPQQRPGHREGRRQTMPTLLWQLLEHWIRSDPVYSHSHFLLLHPNIHTIPSSSPSSSSSTPSGVLLLLSDTAKLFFDTCFVYSIDFFTARLVSPSR
jgi:hypothetical protein